MLHLLQMYYQGSQGMWYMSLSLWLCSFQHNYALCMTMSFIIRYIQVFSAPHALLSVHIEPNVYHHIQ